MMTSPEVKHRSRYMCMCMYIIMSVIVRKSIMRLHVALSYMYVDFENDAK